MTFPVGGISAILELAGAAQFEQGILGAQRSLSLAAGSADTAAAAMDKIDVALTRTGAAASDASSGTTKLRAAQLSAVAATERYNTLLNDSSASVARLASSEASMLRANDRLAASSAAAAAGLKATATAAEEANGFLAAAGAKAATAMESMAKLGLGLAGFEAVVKGVELVKAGADFQKTMLLIQTNANASATEVKNMSAAVLSMAGQTATAPIELANALYHVEQNGLRGQQALDALRIGAEGAKVGMADVEETTNAMTFAIASGIKGVGDMQKAMGFLITTVGTGDMRMSDLNEALGTGILSVAKGFGATLQDVSAVLATLGDNGIRGADAATGLRQALMGFAKPAVGGADALKSVGLSMTSLRDDMEKNGLVSAMNDLEQHMTTAGVTGTKVGGFITEAFGRKAGAALSVLMGEMDRVNTKFAEVGKGGDAFASKWQATTQTVSFSFQKLGAEAQVAGIKIFDTVGPAVGKVASVLATDLPKAISFVHSAMEPLISVFGSLASTIGPIAHAIGAVGSALAPIEPVLKGVTGAVAAMWLAWKGYGLATAAVRGVMDLVGGMQVKVVNAVASVQTALAGGTDAWTANGLAAYAASEAAQAAKDKEAAVIARANAAEAESYAQLVAASDDATATMISNSQNQALAAQEAAAVAEKAAADSAAAAETAATSVASSGEAAEVGWSALLGPIGLAAIGITTLVSLFHKSSTASQEATNAAKAYSDALSSGGKSDLFSTIVEQLKDNSIPQKIDALNQSMGRTVLTSPQFAKAIQSGGKPLTDLEQNLTGVISKYGMFSTQGKDAMKVLSDLGTQYASLSAAVKKDLVDTKAFYGVSASIDQVAQVASVASATAKTYAAMVGILTDKNGIASVSAKTLAAAVDTVTTAENTATQTGSAFLDALQKFSNSAATAADRATLIGATLKANAGDALNFASVMNSAATSVSQLGTDIASAAKGVGKSGESTRAFLDSIVNLKSSTIDYSKTAAAPLISDLQGIQTAAINAAQATYQHNLSFEDGAKAADDAIAGYKGVETSLEGQLVKLGLTKDAAQQLTEKYLGVPDKVKTLIEQEGANPVLNVLNQIGEQLHYLTGQPWVSTVKATDNASGVIEAIAARLAALRAQGAVDISVNAHGDINVGGVRAKASGGILNGPGTGTSDSILLRGSNGEFVVNAKQTAKHRALLEAINSGTDGFATGGVVGSLQTLINQVGSTRGGSAPQFTLSASVTGSLVVQQILTAVGKLNSALAHGLSASQADPLRQQIIELAALAQKELGQLKIKVDSTDLTALKQSLTGSADQIKTAFGNLVQDVEQLGVPATRLNPLIASANKIADQLGAANAKLAADIQARQQEAQKIAQVIDQFNIATDGFNSTTGTDTGIGGMLGDLQKQVNSAAEFGADLQLLKNMGLNSTSLEQLAEAGPTDQTMQRIQELLAAGPGQIQQINDLVGLLAKDAGSVGDQLAGDLYNAGISADQGLIKGLQSKESDIYAQVKKIADGIVAELQKDLKIHSPSLVMRELGGFVGAGLALGMNDAHPLVLSASKNLANVSLPKLGGAGRALLVPRGSDGSAALVSEVRALRGDVAALGDRLEQAEAANAHAVGKHVSSAVREAKTLVRAR